MKNLFIALILIIPSISFAYSLNTEIITKNINDGPHLLYMHDELFSEYFKLNDYNDKGILPAIRCVALDEHGYTHPVLWTIFTNNDAEKLKRFTSESLLSSDFFPKSENIYKIDITVYSDSNKATVTCVTVS